MKTLNKGPMSTLGVKKSITRSHTPYIELLWGKF